MDHGMVILASPYTDFKQVRSNVHNDGVIKITFDEFVNSFEYLVVGYSIKNY